MRIVFGLIFFANLILLQKVGATELFEVNNSVRALGMGNAFTAVAKEADALFYNPAGHARTTGFNWIIMDPGVGANGYEGVNFLTDLTKATSGAALTNFVNSHYGDHAWVGAGAKTAFTMPFLGVAIYDHLGASVGIENPAYTNFELNALNDFGYTVGAGIPILPVMQVGMNVRYVKRRGNLGSVGPGVLSTLDASKIQAAVDKPGDGYAMDLGANILIPGPVSPVLSLVWKDVGVTTFTPGDVTLGAPPRQLDEIVLGAALNVDLPLVSVAPAFDFKYLNRTDVQLTRKIHLGVELGIPMFDFRAGFSEGYYTWGLGFNLGLIRVDAASYGVEMGDYPGQREDRRYAVQVSMELGFDPGLGFLGGGSGGSKSGSGSKGSSSSGGGGWGGRRLKQRR